MYELLSYLLLLIGATAVTIGILGRFVYRGETRFNFGGWARLGLFVGGMLLLAGSVLLYAYQFEIDTLLLP